METTRPSRPLFAIFLLLGNLAFVGAWAMVLWKPTGWLPVGVVLVALFLALRVGGMWWHVRRGPDTPGVTRRSALVTTVIAVLGVVLWGVTAMRGPREGPRVERRVITDVPPRPGTDTRQP